MSFKHENDIDKIHSGISPLTMVELKKCRSGLEEQEFWVIPAAKSDHDSSSSVSDGNEFILKHVLTNVTITDSEGLSTSNNDGRIELRRVFLEDYKQFHNSDD